MVVAVVNATPTPDINAYKAALRQYEDAESLQLGINMRSKLRLVRFDCGGDEPVPIATATPETD